MKVKLDLNYPQQFTMNHESLKYHHLCQLPFAMFLSTFSLFKLITRNPDLS